MQLCIPLRCEDEVIGVIWLHWKDEVSPQNISDEDLRWLFVFGNQLGSALAYSRLQRRRYVVGFGHDQGGNILSGARSLANTVHKEYPGVGLFVDYVRDVVSAYDACLSRVVKPKVTAKADDLRRIVYRAAHIAEGDFLAYRENNPPGGKAYTFRFSGVEGKGFADASGLPDQLLSVALVNIFRNAVAHGSGTCRVEVALEERNGQVVLRIVSTNPTKGNVDEGALKSAAEGSGGLYLVNHIIEEMFSGELRMEARGKEVIVEAEVPVEWQVESSNAVPE